MFGGVFVGKPGVFGGVFVVSGPGNVGRPPPPVVEAVVPPPIPEVVCVGGGSVISPSHLDCCPITGTSQF